MKRSIALFTSAACAALIGASVCVAEQTSKPETAVLPTSEYRKPLDEIIVEGQRPYWQGDAAPRWDKPKVVAPKPDDVSGERLQWAPGYTHDERDDYAAPRDTSANPPPRAKVFELKF